MKKSIMALVMLANAANVHAQDTFEPLKDRQLYFDVLNIVAILSVIYLITSFILQLVKSYLAHKLKNKIIERQTPIEIVQQLVVPEKKEKGMVFGQWACVLAGIAAGFLIVRFTLPFGIHSLTILAAAAAGGCAGAYYFTRQSPKI